MQHKSFVRQINDGKGYTTDVRLGLEELAILQKMIRIQWLYRIQLLAPDKVHLFDQYGIERYHELSYLLEHESVWPTYARTFPKEAIPIIRNMNFFKKLEEEFGWVGIGDEQNFGWGNVYWRLVRPGKNDTGFLHADRWFWDIFEYQSGPPSFPHQRLKIWIAIYTVPGKNGLLVVPDSHRNKDWKWHAEVRHNQKKPVIDEPLESLDIQLLNTEPGQSVIFHDDLLHGGSENHATTTRVSIEFTLFIPEQTKSVFSSHNVRNAVV